MDAGVSQLDRVELNSEMAPRWLSRLVNRGHRTAVRAWRLSRADSPRVGQSVKFEPIGRLGKTVQKYKGERCEILAESYEVPAGVNESGWVPFLAVQFADGKRYCLAPWHLLPQTA